MTWKLPESLLSKMERETPVRVPKDGLYLLKMKELDKELTLCVKVCVCVKVVAQVSEDGGSMGVDR